MLSSYFIDGCSSKSYPPFTPILKVKRKWINDKLKRHFHLKNPSRLKSATQCLLKKIYTDRNVVLSDTGSKCLSSNLTVTIILICKSLIMSNVIAYLSTCFQSSIFHTHIPPSSCFNISLVKLQYFSYLSGEKYSCPTREHQLVCIC